MEKNTVQLSGFSPVERIDATVAVDKFLAKIKRHAGDFDEFIVAKKQVHGPNGSMEINANLFAGGHRYHSQDVKHSLSEALSGVFTTLEAAVEKRH